MADTVTKVVDDLERRLNKVPAVSQKMVYLYREDDLYSPSKKLSYPYVGVVYSGMLADDRTTRREVAVVLTCNVFLVGADLCRQDVDTELPKATSLLEQMRTAILVEPASSGERKWKFMSESPFEVMTDGKAELLGYVQRWTTVFVLWP
jgi:hypothetical protein